MPQPTATPFPYTTLFRSRRRRLWAHPFFRRSQNERTDAAEVASQRFDGGPPGQFEALRGNLSRSEEHTSELQSRGHVVCRLLLAKKKEVLALRDQACHHA